MPMLFDEPPECPIEPDPTAAGRTDIASPILCFPIAAIEAATEAIVAMSVDGTIRFFSPGAETLFGRTASATVGQPVTVLMGPADAASHPDYVGRYLAGAPPRIIGTTREVTGLHANGAALTLDLRVVPLRVGGEDVFLATMRDASERKARVDALSRLSAELGARNQLLHDALAAIDPGVCIVEADGRLDHVSPRLAQMLGLPREALRAGLTLTEAIATISSFGPLRDPGTADALRRLTEIPAAVDSAQATLHAADGRAFEISFRRMASGRSLLIVAETTDRERAAREAAESLSAARAAAAAKAQFIENIGHELRTPLNAVIGFAEALSGGIPGPPSDRQREYLSHLLSGARDLQALVDEFMSIAESFGTAAPAADARCALDTALEESYAHWLPAARAARLDLAIPRPAPTLRLRIDARSLRIILNSLVSNAIVHSKPGGHIDIRVTEGARGVTIGVRDDGPGIPAKDLERVFEPFVRLESAFLRARAGRGMGLFTARTIARRFGGDVTLDSLERRGTIASLRLPLAEPGLAKDDASG